MITHCEPTFRIWVEVERHDPEADSYENIDREHMRLMGRLLLHILLTITPEDMAGLSAASPPNPATLVHRQ